MFADFQIRIANFYVYGSTLVLGFSVHQSNSEGPDTLMVWLFYFVLLKFTIDNWTIPIIDPG